MTENIEIKVVIDPSLATYFEEGMKRSHIEIGMDEEFTGFLAVLLNDSMYPIASCVTGDREIHLSYRPKAYADPIF